MLSILIDFSSILDFSKGLLAGAASALIISRFLEPLYDALIDSFKNNSGAIGKLYKSYTRTIGRYLFLKKNGRHKLLQKEGWEYKIFMHNNKITCCRSTILRLDQNIFKRIQGEIVRVSSTNSAFTSYFKGFIKNKDSNYLIWEESFKNSEGSFHLTSHYKLNKDIKDDIPGITIQENNNEVITCFSILSFSKIPYTSVKKLLSNKTYFNNYLARFRINVEAISQEENKILIGK